MLSFVLGVAVLPELTLLVQLVLQALRGDTDLESARGDGSRQPDFVGTPSGTDAQCTGPVCLRAKAGWWNSGSDCARAGAK